MSEWLNIAVEDTVSEEVIRRLVRDYRPDARINHCYGRTGYGLLRKRILNWNIAASRLPFLVLTDLDKAACAPSLIREWLPQGVHPNLLLRVAVREIESWILADYQGWSIFLGLNPTPLSMDVEELGDAKAALLKTVKKSRRSLRADLLPQKGTSARVGPNYNGRIIEFVASHWQPEQARQRAASLDRTIRALQRFKPTLPS